MLNRVVLVGRLTKEPLLSYTSSGVAVATFTLAVNRSFTNQAGEREADFINCVVFRKPAENVANFLTKGSLAGVDGRLQSRSYEGQNGRVYVTEVVCDSVQFLETKRDNAQNGPNNAGNGKTNTNTQSNPQTQQKGAQGPQNKKDDPFAHVGQPIDISDDELPF